MINGKILKNTEFKILDYEDIESLSYDELLSILNQHQNVNSYFKYENNIYPFYNFKRNEHENEYWYFYFGDENNYFMIAHQSSGLSSKGNEIYILHYYYQRVDNVTLLSNKWTWVSGNSYNYPVSLIPGYDKKSIIFYESEEAKCEIYEYNYMLCCDTKPENDIHCTIIYTTQQQKNY